MTDPKEQSIHPSTRCCANCLFWEKRTDDGECRRFPPQITSQRRFVRGEDEGDAANTWFPDTDPMHWCGEFKDSKGYSFSHEIAETEAERKEADKRFVEAMNYDFDPKKP